MINYLDFIREIPDFPKPGILFKDITPLLKNNFAFQSAIRDMSEPFIEKSIDSVVAIEARGYIFGAPIAYQLGCGFIPIRKQGKLPGETSRIEYSLEYPYPNPFNPKTSISFSLPNQSQTSIKVLDIKGKLISTLLNESMNVGHHQIEWNADGYPSGVYFVKLDADEFTQTQKLMLVK